MHAFVRFLSRERLHKAGSSSCFVSTVNVLITQQIIVQITKLTGKRLLMHRDAGHRSASRRARARLLTDFASTKTPWVLTPGIRPKAVWRCLFNAKTLIAEILRFYVYF